MSYCSSRHTYTPFLSDSAYTSRSDLLRILLSNCDSVSLSAADTALASPSGVFCEYTLHSLSKSSSACFPAASSCSSFSACCPFTSIRVSVLSSLVRHISICVFTDASFSSSSRICILHAAASSFTPASSSDAFSATSTVSAPSIPDMAFSSEVISFLRYSERPSALDIPDSAALSASAAVLDTFSSLASSAFASVIPDNNSCLLISSADFLYDARFLSSAAMSSWSRSLLSIIWVISSNCFLYSRYSL